MTKNHTGYSIHTPVFAHQSPGASDFIFLFGQVSRIAVDQQVVKAAPGQNFDDFHLEIVTIQPWDPAVRAIFGNHPTILIPND